MLEINELVLSMSDSQAVYSDQVEIVLGERLGFPYHQHPMMLAMF